MNDLSRRAVLSRPPRLGRVRASLGCLGFLGALGVACGTDDGVRGPGVDPRVGDEPVEEGSTPALRGNVARSDGERRRHREAMSGCGELIG